MIRACTKPIRRALLVAAVCLSGGAAAAAPGLVQCTFEGRGAASDLTIILPDSLPAIRSKSLAVGVVPGASRHEVSAVVGFVPQVASGTGYAYLRLGFHLAEPLGFVANIAGNGDALAYRFNLKTKRPDDEQRHFGRCTGAEQLFTYFTS